MEAPYITGGPWNCYDSRRVFEAIQKSAGMETRPTSFGYVRRVSIPAALGLMESPNAAERLWRPLEGPGTATIREGENLH